MPFDAKCPECGSTFKLLDKERGQRFQCEGCDHVFVAGKQKQKESKDIDEPPPRRDPSGLTREQFEKSAGARWNPNRKEDDEPSTKGGSRRVGKPPSGGGVNVITIGVLIFFGVSALGVGIWVAVQERDPIPVGPGPRQINPNDFDVFNPPPQVGVDIGMRPPPIQQQPALEPKDFDVDTLLAVVNGQPGVPIDKHRAMAELALRKEPRGIQPIAQRLSDFWDRVPAENALRTYGAAAEKQVLPYFNHLDGATRDTARRLLKDYNTAQDLLVTQSLTDLNSADLNVQLSAHGWLADQVPLPGRAAEVTRAQETALTSKNDQLRDSAMRGLLNWGSKENTPAVARLLESLPKQGIPGETHKRALQALGKWKDLRGVPAILPLLQNFFITNDAAKALEQFGPEAAKDVVKFMNHPDQGLSNRIRKILAGYGTKDDVLVTQCLEDLKGMDANQRRHATQWLEKAKPDEKRRGEVAKALVPVLKDQDHWTQEAGFKAMKVWLDKEAVPGLLAIVEDNAAGFRFRGQRGQVMEMLASLKDERAIEPLGAPAYLAG